METGGRLRLAWNEINRVLGGGIVPGSLVLLGGEPGVGKSTLLLQLCQQVAATGAAVLYCSGEESAMQIKLRGERLSGSPERILIFTETDVEHVVEAIRRTAPALAVVDSIQTLEDAELAGSAGSIAQVRECTARLMQLAKSTGIPILLVGHVTKEGAIAGPRVLEHAVDVVLYLEGDRQQELRVLRAQKNRFGSTEEIGILAMGGEGFEEVPDPAGLLSGLGREAAGGSALTVTLEGTRPLLVELQVLALPTSFGIPRRTATGVDLNRLHMLLAVLEKRLQTPFGQSDVYVNVAGGLRLAEPAGDLALALGLLGSARNTELPAGLVAIGEVGLGGEIRPVRGLDRRLAEAARRGVGLVLVPPGPARAPEGLRVRSVASLTRAVEMVFGEGPLGAPAAGHRVG